MGEGTAREEGVSRPIPGWLAPVLVGLPLSELLLVAEEAVEVAEAISSSYDLTTFAVTKPNTSMRDNAKVIKLVKLSQSAFGLV